MITGQGVYDVVIIGAGPAGLACAIEAKKHNLNYLVIEKGCLVNSVFHFPTNLILFSTPDLLEIGGVPFIIPAEKPSRTDLLKYYRRVADHYDLKVHLHEKVESVAGGKGAFQIQSVVANNGFGAVSHPVGKYLARHVVVATGQYDNPNYLNIPGENLKKVSHYFTETHPHFKKKVAIIGGKNSAVEAALELYRDGAEVTLIHRGPELGKSVKYWIRPDIENRIKEGKIRALFNTTVEEIREKSVVVRRENEEVEEIENDFVFAMTGYKPEVDFLTRLGIELESNWKPAHDPNTLETNVPGVYIAGVITVGAEGSKVFIENSRNHGKQIIGNILNGKK